MNAADAGSRGPRRARPAISAWVLVAVLVLSGCAARRFTLATGSRSAAPEGAAIWRDATRACQSARVYSSTLRPGGRIGGDRIPAGLSVAAGLDEAGRIRLEGRALGRLLFTLAGSTERAVLVLHREQEFVVDRAERIVEALLGVAFDPARLLVVLAGCATAAGATGASLVGDVLEIVTGDARVYLERQQDQWRPRLAFTAGMQVDYAARQGGWPSDVRIWGEAGADPRVELRVRIDTVLVNAAIPDQAFAIDVPAGAREISLDDLRRAVREGRR